MMITMGDNELRSIVHQLTHSPSLPSSQSLPVAAAKFSLLTFFPLFVQYKYLLLSMYGRFIAWILVALDLYPEIADANFKCMLWTFKQQLTLKFEYVVKFLLFSYTRLCTVYFGICQQHVSFSESVNCFIDLKRCKLRSPVCFPTSSVDAEHVSHRLQWATTSKKYLLILCNSHIK